MAKTQAKVYLTKLKIFSDTCTD